MRAEQVISGATRIVVSRSRGLSMTRVAMMPGMAQAKLDKQRDEGAPVQAGAAHDAVHQEGGARHVAEILQQEDEQEQDQDLGQEDQHAADARDDAVLDEALHQTLPAAPRGRRRRARRSPPR